MDLRETRETFINKISEIPYHDSETTNIILLKGDKYTVLKYEEELVSLGLSAFPELEKKNKLLLHLIYTRDEDEYYYALNPYEEDTVIPVLIKIDTDEETSSKYLIFEFN